MDVDFVIVGVGIVSGIGLVEIVGVVLDNGIKIDVEGCILVDGIWVVGDCVFFFYKDMCICLESVLNVID